MLSKVGDGEVGFYQLKSGVNVGAGKAYLKIDNPSDAKLKVVFGGDDITGINNVNAANPDSETVYNLNGCRVNDSYKGIVIVNGKKVIRK